jgi:hypothetical protein
MIGRTRLPGGEPRKASHRRTRRGEPLPTRMPLNLNVTAVDAAITAASPIPCA